MTGMEWLKMLLVLGTLAVKVVELGASRGLNDFISHYEPLHYDHNSLMWHHHRVTRSLMGPQKIELEFYAFDRPFELALEPDRDLFHENFTLLYNEVPADQYQTKSFMYRGTVTGDSGSVVRGNLAHGVFDGVMKTQGVVYHIEPASRYSAHFPGDGPPDFHSVIYRQSDLNSTSLKGTTCGLSDRSVLEGMSHMQEEGWSQDHAHLRKKRQTGSRDLSRVRCWLSVRIDHKAYTNYLRTGQDPTATVLNIVTMGSDIFRRTDFNMDGNPDNIQFGVLEMIVETTPPPSGNFFANDFIGVEAFLNQHSVADYSDFCLAYRFTHRDFEGGVVGLAYVAPQPPGTASGGICEKPRRFSGGVVQTLNTGIVTSENYGRDIPPSISTLTFAHECGHNFGSNHDTGDPPADGAYIMYAFATSGNQPNNDEFSPASRDMMNNVIAARGQNEGGCFVEGGNLCGNNLVDEGEDCDCGPASNLNDDGICRNNTCCLGRNCTLAPDVLCSPDQGLCCDNSCMFITNVSNITCSLESDCAFSQICDGSSHLCPPATAKSPAENSTFILCENEEGICDGTSCNGTICLALDLMDCECTALDQACHVCCLLEDRCTSTMELATNNATLRDKLPNMMGRFVQVGRPCANFTGYCDFLNNCTLVDEDGALARLANLFFNSELFRRTLDFVTNMWWVVVIAVVAVFVIMFIVVILFHCFLPRAEIVKSHPRRKPSFKKRVVPQDGAPPYSGYDQYRRY